MKQVGMRSGNDFTEDVVLVKSKGRSWGLRARKAAHLPPHMESRCSVSVQRGRNQDGVAPRLFWLSVRVAVRRV